MRLQSLSMYAIYVEAALITPTYRLICHMQQAVQYSFLHKNTLSA